MEEITNQRAKSPSVLKGEASNGRFVTINVDLELNDPIQLVEEDEEDEISDDDEEEEVQW